MITDKPIEMAALAAGIEPTSGAVVSFAGVVRARNDGRAVRGIFYDCYREMAEREIAKIAAETEAKYGLDTVRIVHRTGELGVGEVSLGVVVASPHRREAFEACSSIVDAVKARVPIWKKERFIDGDAQWHE